MAGRDSNGNYTLAAGNPVVAGTVIDVDWANPTMDDLEAALTDSLSRSGKGGMLQAFKAINGTALLPGIAFNDDAGSGISKANASEVVMTADGNSISRWFNQKLDFNTGTTASPVWKQVLYDGGTFTDLTVTDLTVTNELKVYSGIYSGGESPDVGVVTYGSTDTGFIIGAGEAFVEGGDPTAKIGIAGTELGLAAFSGPFELSAAGGISTIDAAGQLLVDSGDFMGFTATNGNLNLTSTGNVNPQGIITFRAERQVKSLSGSFIVDTRTDPTYFGGSISFDANTDFIVDSQRDITVTGEDSISLTCAAGPLTLASFAIASINGAQGTAITSGAGNNASIEAGVNGDTLVTATGTGVVQISSASDVTIDAEGSMLLNSSSLASINGTLGTVITSGANNNASIEAGVNGNTLVTATGTGAVQISSAGNISSIASGTNDVTSVGLLTLSATGGAGDISMTAGDDISIAATNDITVNGTNAFIVIEGGGSNRGLAVLPNQNAVYYPGSASVVAYDAGLTAGGTVWAQTFNRYNTGFGETVAMQIGFDQTVFSTSTRSSRPAGAKLLIDDEFGTVQLDNLVRDDEAGFNLLPAGTLYHKQGDDIVRAKGYT